MQNTTADYKIEINKPSRSFECKITIGNNIYTNEDLVNLTLEYTQPQEGFSIGNTISQSLDLTLLNRGDIIYSTSQIKVEIGLKIGSTIEYILMGIFNIDDIEKTDYTTKFTAYDNMIKFETAYYSSLGDNPTLQQVVNELSSKTGVEFTGSLPSYTVNKLDGFTCREVLSYVASICGGNAFITRDGKFTIKSLSEVEKAIDGSNYFEYKREEVKYKVGKISCQVDENNILSKGSIGTDSMELGFENQWVTETILTEIYNKLNGVSYLGYYMKWQGDIALDPYDIITVTDVKNVVRKIPILSQKLTYTGGLTSEIGAKGETKNKNSFSSSGSTTNKVNRLVTEQAVIKEALIDKANIKDLEVSNAKIENLEAKTAKIEEAIIDVAYISDLTAINANIQTLFANDATINNALINKANITDLTATNIKFEVASGGVLDLQTLLAKHITGENGQFINISSDNTVIANAVIKDAMIENISVSKLLAGTISTNKFTVASDDGGITIVGPTMQFKDKSNKVRLQLGQDTTGDFNFILRAADGTTTLIDGYGIKEKAIADDLIKENMIAADAIGEKQINYSSFITGLNKDDNTSLIKASKVAIDFTGQSLEVSFNSLKSNVDNMEIGVRNLAKNTKTLSGMSGIANTSGNWYNNTKDGDFNKLTINTTNTGWIECQMPVYAQYNSLVNDVTISFDYKSSGDVLYFSIGAFNSSGGRVTEITNISVQSSFKKITLANGWYRAYYTLKLTSINNNSSATTYKLQFKKGSGRTGSVEVKRIKFEEGNKPTDWTPAPEDVDYKIESNTTAISAAQGKIEGLISENTIIKSDVTTISDKYTSLKATVDGINTTVASHTSSIGTINNTISGLSGKVTTVENKYTSLEQNLNGFKTTVANNYSTKTELSGVDGKVTSLTSRVSTSESSIDQLNNQIKLKVEATDVTNAINNVKVGGDSVLRNGNFANGLNNWSTHDMNSGGTSKGILVKTGDGVWSPSDKKVLIIQGTNTTDRYGVRSSTMKLIPNTKYTISGYCAGHRVGKIQVNVRDVKNADANIFTQNFTPVSGGATLDKWYRFELTFTTTSNTDFVLNLYSVNMADNGYVWFSDVQIQIGTKATAWTPCNEDVNSAIASVDSRVTTTNNKVASIETNLSSITSRVSSTESSIKTINGNVSSLQSRMSSAEQKITSSAIISTVQSTINTAKAEAINSANSATDTKLKNYSTTTQMNTAIEQKANSITNTVSSTYLSKSDATNTYATKSSLTQTTDKIIADFKASGGYNLLKNSDARNGTSFWSSNGGGLSIGTAGLSPFEGQPEFKTSFPSGMKYNEDLRLKSNTDYVYEAWIYTNTAISSSSITPLHFWCSSSAGTSGQSQCTIIDYRQTLTQGRFSKVYVHFKTKSGNVFFRPFIYSTATASSITVKQISLSEGTVEQPWSPHPDEVYSGSTIIDANGITVNNGALTIKNKSGTTVFQGDTNGNLVFTGTAKSQSGAQFVSLDSGGITFQDYHRNEQMLRIGISYFDSNRDMNGVTFAMPQCSDFIRFAHISKEDLTNGWTSSDSQYRFLDFWIADQTVGGVSYKKGINVHSPMFVNNGIQLFSGTNYPAKISGAVSWDNGSGTIWNMMGLYGDNGAVLGYQNGSNLNARIVVTEGAHPGTDDRIKSWGHWNCSGYTVHNATFRGSHVNSYANEVTRTFTETHCIEAENKQVRINFTDIQLVDCKAILNIPKAYIGINAGYIVNSIVKKGKGDVWILEEQESRFIIEGTADIKVNIEVIINLDNTSSYSLKSGNDEQLCIDMTTGQPIGA